MIVAQLFALSRCIAWYPRSGRRTGSESMISQEAALQSYGWSCSVATVVCTIEQCTLSGTYNGQDSSHRALSCLAHLENPQTMDGSMDTGRSKAARAHDAGVRPAIGETDQSVKSNRAMYARSLKAHQRLAKCRLERKHGSRVDTTTRSTRANSIGRAHSVQHLHWLYQRSCST